MLGLCDLGGLFKHGIYVIQNTKVCCRVTAVVCRDLRAVYLRPPWACKGKYLKAQFVFFWRVPPAHTRHGGSLYTKKLQPWKLGCRCTWARGWSPFWGFSCASPGPVSRHRLEFCTHSVGALRVSFMCVENIWSSVSWISVHEFGVNLGQNLKLNLAEHFLTVGGGCWSPQTSFLGLLRCPSPPLPGTDPLQGLYLNRESLGRGTFWKWLSFCPVGSRLLI